MEKEKVIERLLDFQREIRRGKISIPYNAVAVTKDGEHYHFSNILNDTFINQIMKDKGFLAKDLKTGDYSGDYWVRLSCNPDLGIITSDCKLIAEIDEKNLEDLEMDITNEINENINQEFCENSKYPSLCENAVSIGISNKLNGDLIDATRESIKSEMEKYFDNVEIRNRTRSLESF